MKNKKKTIIIAVLLGLWILNSATAFLFSLDVPRTGSGKQSGRVAVVPITGQITIQSPDTLFSSQGAASSDRLVEQIRALGNDPDVKAVIFEINSPGGSPVATDEISQEIHSLGKLSVGVIREVGASGAYWIASSTDYIFANRMSMTGSIGVVGSYLEFGDLLQRYNVTYQRLIAGKYKDIGTPFREMTPQEKKLLQNLLDQLHEYFIKEVAENRNLTIEETRKLATGMIYLGAEAKELGLVDELGSKEDAIKYIEEQLNISAEVTEYKERKTFIQQLFQSISSFRPLDMENFINPVNQLLLRT